MQQGSLEFCLIIRPQAGQHAPVSEEKETTNTGRHFFSFGISESVEPLSFVGIKSWIPGNNRFSNWSDAFGSSCRKLSDSQ